jgi:hypothetical protein
MKRIIVVAERHPSTTTLSFESLFPVGSDGGRVLESSGGVAFLLRWFRKIPAVHF